MVQKSVSEHFGGIANDGKNIRIDPTDVAAQSGNLGTWHGIPARNSLFFDGSRNIRRPNPILKFRHVNGAFRNLFQERIGEANDFGFHGLENGFEIRDEVRVRNIVGPEGEDSAGVEVFGEFR